MSGRPALRIRVSHRWRVLYAPTPERRAAIEARVPAGHYLAVVAPNTRRPRHWRVDLLVDGDELTPTGHRPEPVWSELVDGPMAGAIETALGRHEPAAAA